MQARVNTQREERDESSKRRLQRDVRDESPKRRQQRERSRSPRGRNNRSNKDQTQHFPKMTAKKKPLAETYKPIYEPKYEPSSPGYSPPPAAFFLNMRNTLPIHSSAIAIAEEREQHELKRQLKKRNEEQLATIKELRNNRDDLRKKLQQANQVNCEMKVFNDQLIRAISEYEKALQIPSSIITSSGNVNTVDTKPLEKSEQKNKESSSSSKKTALTLKEKIERLEEFCRANNAKILEVKEEINSLEKALNAEITKKDKLVYKTNVLKQKLLDLSELVLPPSSSFVMSR